MADNNIIRGFYYDEQLKDPLRTVSLHPSKEWKKGQDSNGKPIWEWKPVQGGKDDSLIFKESSMGVNKTENNVVYRKKPLAVGILTEDISFMTQNEFTDSNGSDAVGDFMKSIKPYAAVAARLKKAGQTADTLSQDSALGGLASGAANSAMQFFGDLADSVEKNLNKQLIVTGTRYTTYNGSNFNINNLELKYTKFSDWVEGTDKFESVIDHIKEVGRYAFGRYVPLNSRLAQSPTLNGLIPKKMLELGDEFISQMCGYQEAPGGFMMGNGRSLDIALEGTLRLNIGNSYAIENLIIKNFNFTLSKIQTKNPTVEGGVCPLYADIVISLAPASMITDRTLSKILDNEGLGESIQDVQDNLFKSLNDIKQRVGATVTSTTKINQQSPQQNTQKPETTPDDNTQENNSPASPEGDTPGELNPDITDDMYEGEGSDDLGLYNPTENPNDYTDYAKRFITDLISKGNI